VTFLNLSHKISNSCLYTHGSKPELYQIPWCFTGQKLCNIDHVLLNLWVHDVKDVLHSTCGDKMLLRGLCCVSLILCAHWAWRSEAGVTSVLSLYYLNFDVLNSFRNNFLSCSEYDTCFISDIWRSNLLSFVCVKQGMIFFQQLPPSVPHHLSFHCPLPIRTKRNFWPNLHHPPSHERSLKVGAIGVRLFVCYARVINATMLISIGSI